MPFKDLREEYSGAELLEADLDADPLVQFRRWFADAVAAELPLANGMTLATVGADGRPAARIVLLKEVDERGFVFFSNYESRKGRHLAANRAAALVFWWPPLHRQVRVEGHCSRIPAEESDAYFETRPAASNLSAIASAQSQPVASREALDAAYEAAAERVGAGKIERPAHWGGYVLAPDRFEFWQGREDRLHDRIEYSLSRDNSWTVGRLFP